MTLSDLQLQAWLAAFLMPLVRIGALIVAAPVFNSKQAPMRWRALLALALTLVIAPTLPPSPMIDPFSLPGIITIAGEMFIGLAMGIILQMAFAAMVFAGQVIAHKMGLGFAQMVDPQNGVQVPVVSQYYLILSTLLFLLLNGHLLLIELLASSFRSLPIGEGLGPAGFYAVVGWGSEMFSGGLLVALPAVAALLLVNLGFGVIGRAAPQLHIFAIGFPMAILIGFVMMWLSLPGSMDGFEHLLEGAFGLVKTLLQIRS